MMVSKRVISVLILIFFIAAFFSQNLFAAKSQDESQARVKSPLASRVVEYAFPESNPGLVTNNKYERTSLDPTKTGVGFGEKMGFSYYEFQHFGSMHRQISWGSTENCPWTMHLIWMMLPSAILEDREVETSGWDGASGTIVGFYSQWPNYGYSGFPTLEVTDDNRLIRVAHNRLAAGANYRTQYWIQHTCNTSFYSVSDRVPDSLNDCGNTHIGNTDDAAVIWPDIAYQEPPDGAPIIHLIGSSSSSFDGVKNLSYFQKVDPEDGSNGIWTFGCAIDTVYGLEGYDLCASPNGTVAITWVGLLPDEPGCDTCSQSSSTGSAERDRWDNDLYYQLNRNFGRGNLGDLYNPTPGGNYWEPRVNVTRNDAGVNGYRPFADLSTIITTDEKYHVAFVAMEWDELDMGRYASRIFHWSEDLGFSPGGKGNIRTVTAAQWEPENCTPSSFSENVAKVQISECNNRLYVMWVEYNSPNTTGNENHDDCGQRAFDGDSDGAANGDLFLSVSGDYGLTWDYPRGITNSYGGRSAYLDGKACDPVGNGPCPTESWSTMNEQGSDYPIVGPSVSNICTTYAMTTGAIHDNSFYLDIAYMDDIIPGGAINSEGEWTNNDYLWMRIPCVKEITLAGFTMNITEYGFPNCLKHGDEAIVNLVIENNGTADLHYTTTIVEDQPGVTGWLTLSGDFDPFDGLIEYGQNNKEIGSVVLNGNLAINSPGTVVRVTGRVIFDHDAPSGSDVFEVELVVADTCVQPTWDTIQTACTELIVASNGTAGNTGSPGRVNLAYDTLSDGEWNPLFDRYLYDNSTIIGSGTGGNATMNWGMYGVNIADSVALLPQDIPGKAPSHSSTFWADIYNTGVFTNNDSSIAVEVTWHAPTDPAFSCGFVIKHTKVYSFDGAPHDDIIIGEVADWDVPSDSGTDNSHGFGNDGMFAGEEIPDFVYQGGLEYADTLPSPDEEWPSDERYGAMMYLGGYEFSTLPYEYGAIPDRRFDLFNIYTGSNGRLVYPYHLGFNVDTLRLMHSIPGTILSDSSAADMHSGMTYVSGLDLGGTDTLHFFTAFMTTMNSSYPDGVTNTASANNLANIAADARDFFTPIIPPGCCELMGDANHDGDFSISDLTYFVDYLFVPGAPAPACFEEFDLNGDCELGISDLTYVVCYMFDPFCPEPVPCHICK